MPSEKLTEELDDVPLGNEEENRSKIKGVREKIDTKGKENHSIPVQSAFAQENSYNLPETPDDFPPAARTSQNGTPVMPETPRTPTVPEVRVEGIPSRPRTDSQSTAATTRTIGSTTRNSLVFVVTALENIANSKDARKIKRLGDSVQRALAAIKEGGGDPQRTNPEVLFEPLYFAAELQGVSIPVVTSALDCIGKLISYSYFSTPAEQQSHSPDQPPLIERAIDTICDCYQSEATPNEIQLQIIKSLLAAILNDKIVVHGAGLLKAIRLTYNIFLTSKSSANQQVAQGALTQMVGTVFERVKTRIAMKETRINSSKASLSKDVDGAVDVTRAHSADGTEPGGLTDMEPDGDIDSIVSPGLSDLPAETHAEPKITLQSFEDRTSFDDATISEAAPTLVTRVHVRRTPSRNTINDGHTSNGHSNGIDRAEEDEEDEIFVKDAYLVLRAMCKLSTKVVPPDQAVDVRSQAMRSKLLALHIIHTILHNQVAVFISPYATIKSSSSEEPTTFVQATKQWLCLSLSRNGASSTQRVFEVSCEIFFLMVVSLRVMLKKEIEVFLKEIYFALLDKRGAPIWQKQYILGIFGRLARDSRTLVEIYLNYDCDGSALDNMFQRTVEYLSRFASTPVTVSAIQQHAYQDRKASSTDWPVKSMLPPSLATASIHPANETEQGFPLEYGMKYEALQAIVDILNSLVSWAQQTIIASSPRPGYSDSRGSVEDFRGSTDTREAPSPNPGADTGSSTPVAEDDPGQFEREKRRKTALTEAVRSFNFKPKRGIKMLVNKGFISSHAPEEIARFLLTNEQLDKSAIGEYLGEGEPENIAIMHAFVDSMEFRQMRFVDALRRFLQSFRLPGEAQKIDRFMLKFAERYISGNPNAFANADTAYVLAYSVIMLNTDQHSTKMKGARMTPEDFIKNNRGINDGADLPEEYLRAVYEEIANHEIVLDTERERAANLGLEPQQTGTLAGRMGEAIANVGRDLQREAHMQASEEIANKTTELYRNLLRAQRRAASRMNVAKFVPAMSFKHVGPMFQVTWMPFLTALSGVAQETHNLETIGLCMQGMRLAIRISCLFDLADPRQAFVSQLARFTNLYNLSEMKTKNMEALKVLLEVAQNEGNFLKESWRDILTCISQLDRFQLISTGVDSDAVPDVLKASVQPRSTGVPKKSLAVPHKNPRRTSQALRYQSDIAEESRSADMIRSVDRIFTNTANLSGDAIVHFVTALTQVSWQEIQSSGNSESPRTYSLQKLVEISEYNMTRVRFEWTKIWQALGQHFTQVGCHTNTNVVFFALDSLRQLSMRFMEIEELPGFKFQKDFLKPFELIIGNTAVVTVKDMVLRCLIQMIQARGDRIRSGWRTMFGVFTVAAREPYESIVGLAFDNVSQVYNTRFGVVISQGAFADLIVCLTEFSKNIKFQKKSLQAIELLKSSVSKMLRTPECPLSARAGLKQDKPQAVNLPKQPTQQTEEEQFWFPVLFAFHDVLMTGEDLEVRSRALNYLFEILIRHGGGFPQDFWDILWRQLLYPIFMVLKSKSEMSKVVNHEELSVWLSTTMIQALRNMITLFTHFFQSLEYMLDRFLDLLALCICQENDTLARIGSNCLQQLILQNVTKFSSEHWNKIVGAFVELFSRTEATALFSAVTSPGYPPSNGARPSQSASTAQQHTKNTPSLDQSTESSESELANNALGINGLPASRKATASSADEAPLSSPSSANLEDYGSAHESIQQATVVVTAARRRFFNQIITKCVLQLLMIETVNELFSNDAVYAQIPSLELLRLMSLLKNSYQFAKRFNGDRELRTRLFREGFMKQPPNLLKQESGSAAVYVSILFRMYHDTSSERAGSRAEVEEALVPLCLDIISSYIELDEEIQQRNISTWRPVVVDVLDGFTGFPPDDFERHVKTFAPLTVGLLNREMGVELQRAVQVLLHRIFEVGLGVATEDMPLLTPTSPRGSILVRRGSRGR